MKKSFFSLIFLLCIVTLSAQNVVFFYTTSILTPTTTKVSIFAEATAPTGNNLTGLDFEFWYDNTRATLSSINTNPLTSAAGLNWGTGNQSFTAHSAGMNAMIPIVHTGRMLYANLDQDFMGNSMPMTPTLLLELNFTNVMGITEGYFASTAQTAGLVYIDDMGTSYPIVIVGAPQQQILPLELTKLAAQAVNSDIEVSWQSAQETNFSHFDLERSTNGHDFSKIAKIAGKGGLRNDYSFTDKEVKSGIIYYYRLKMTDLDAKFKYSNIVQATIAGKNMTLINVSPNPSMGNLNIQYDTPDESDVKVTLFDINGKLMEIQQFTSAKGLNTHNMDISTYPSGVYWLVLSDGYNQVNHKIVKTDR